MMQIGILAAILAFAVACAAEGPSEPQAPQQPAAAAPAAPATGAASAPQSPQQPAAPAPAATAVAAVAMPTPAFIQPGAVPQRVAPTPMPASSMGPEGSLVMADEDIDFPARVPKKTGCTDHDNNIRWGVDEGAIFWSAEEVAYEPGLATSWEFGDDLLSLTFDIRRGVQYHDGWGEVTGHDWKWAWETTMEADSIFPIFLGRDHIDAIEVPDDYTVTMRLTKPNIFFLDTNIPTAGCGSVPFASKKRVDELGEEKAHTDLTGGTGPFKYTKFDSGDRAVMEAVPGHWRNDSNYQTVTVVEIPEAATQVAALLVGDVDSAIVPVTPGAALRRLAYRAQATARRRLPAALRARALLHGCFAGRHGSGRSLPASRIRPDQPLGGRLRQPRRAGERAQSALGGVHVHRPAGDSR